jgi:hypothetical protein
VIVLLNRIGVIDMTGILRVPRSRGALSGIVLVLLGAWGALIPFIGPYFHYAYSPDHAWTYSSGRLWLEILPGAATLLGGLIVLAAATRPTAVFGAWLAALGGGWFVVGRTLSTLWTSGGTVAAGNALGSTVTRAVEDIGFFTGLGAVIIFFAAMALGRFTVIGAREARLAEQEAAAEARTDEPVTAPQATVPASTVPASTVPASTVPSSTVPSSTGMHGTPPMMSDRPAGMTSDRPAGKHSAQDTDSPS